MHDLSGKSLLFVQLLEEMFATGCTSSPEGTSIKIHGNIDKRKCAILTHLIQQHKPTTSLEVGLAYGISALAICDALPKANKNRHIIIDPHQNRKPVWGGIGLANLNRAGFGNLIEFHEQPSYHALPILESRHKEIDFAFIDGWHTFDYTLLDFFYIDKMLRVGGIVAFDDADWPAVRSVCRFIATNLAYSVYHLPKEFQMDEEASKLKQHYFSSLLSATKQLFHKNKSRRDHQYNSVIDLKLRLKGNFIVFRKEAEDTRRWDHFVQF